MIDTNYFTIKDLGTDANYELEDAYKLRLRSKRLPSGKCQVKFFATLTRQRDLYGYVLVDSDQTLKEVVGRIRKKLTTIQYARDHHQVHLYSIGKRAQDNLNMMIFDSE